MQIQRQPGLHAKTQSQRNKKGLRNICLVWIKPWTPCPYTIKVQPANKISNPTVSVLIGQCWFICCAKQNLALEQTEYWVWEFSQLLQLFCKSNFKSVFLKNTTSMRGGKNVDNPEACRSGGDRSSTSSPYFTGLVYRDYLNSCCKHNFPSWLFCVSICLSNVTTYDLSGAFKNSSQRPFYKLSIVHCTVFLPK